MGMTDSRSARSTPIPSASTNPDSQPEAPESQVPHYPEGHRGDIKVRVRVGYKGGTSPGQKDIAYRQLTTTLRTKPVRANQPFTALLRQA